MRKPLNQFQNLREDWRSRAAVTTERFYFHYVFRVFGACNPHRLLLILTTDMGSWARDSPDEKAFGTVSKSA